MKGKRENSGWPDEREANRLRSTHSPFILYPSSLLLEGAETMARGWESKSVADQIEEGEHRLPERAPEPDRSPEGRLRRQQLESLKLSRSRTLAQLDRASSPAYRQMLEKALRALEEQIEEVSRLLS